ncbi:hypothetical protein [Butyrivibrio sp. AE3003]|uniref:hypothetical protein n=1 Tax=Butyrivibrio sp. AE3003 TaxID=1496721 RepID=UPI000479D9B8|nr:hypothetical protein [Butyrivibrio sp. AE3003]
MKLKYYLRGIGLGVVLTAIIMGFALGARNAPVSDAEVIEKAKDLGMVEGGVLSDYSGEDASTGEAVKEEPDNSAPADKVTDTAKGVDAGPSLPDTSASDSAAGGADIEKPETSAGIGTGTGTSTVANGISGAVEKASSAGNSVSAKNADKNKDKDKEKEKPVVEKKKEEVQEEPEEVEEEPAEEPEDNSGESTSSPSPANPVQVTIPGGSSSDKVAKILHDAGLVDDAIQFNKFLIEKGWDRKIHSGTKSISQGASYEEIAKAITQ